MEKQHRLTKDNVEELERILNEVDKELAGKVEHYRHETSKDKPLQCCKSLLFFFCFFVMFC